VVKGSCFRQKSGHDRAPAVKNEAHLNRVPNPLHRSVVRTETGKCGASGEGGFLIRIAVVCPVYVRGHDADIRPTGTLLPDDGARVVVPGTCSMACARASRLDSPVQVNATWRGACVTGESGAKQEHSNAHDGASVMEPFILIAIAAIAIVVVYVVWARRSHPESTRPASPAETRKSGRDEQQPL
jgi:hypothetical protein